jgi:hypothetical protein
MRWGTLRLLPLYNNQLTWPESKHRVRYRHDPCIQFEARRTYEINGFRVTAQLQPHHDNSYGYRFEKDGRVVERGTMQHSAPQSCVTQGG